MAKVEGGGVGGASYLRPKSRHDREFGSRMSVLLSNPDYLLEGFAEKKCQFIGVLDDVPMTTDMSDRTRLLSTLDRKRNTGQLPWSLGKEHSVSLTISAYNMKVIKEDRGGAILHRLPIHKIASASYINDDDHHLVFLKAGEANLTNCSCYIFSFAKRADAEDVCSILQQTFQLVYTEATMEHLNDSISAGERGGWRGSRTSLGTGERGWRGSRSSLMLASKSRGAGPGTSPPKSPTSPATPPPSQLASVPSVPTLVEETTKTEGFGEESTSAVELVQDYMERLHELLDFKELREFATLLKQYREDLNVQNFLMQLKTLYGKHRAFLIPDMNSFIPEEDKPAFQKFLLDNNLQSKSQADAATPPAPPPPPGVAPPPPPSFPPPSVPHPPRAEGGGEGGAPTSIDSFLLDADKENDDVLTTNF